LTDHNTGKLKNRSFISNSLIAVILISFLSSCNKKPDQVGLGLQPQSSELSVIFDQSAGLLSYSIREDSVRTDANAIQTGMLGSMMDPEFGQTTAEIYSQFRLSENGQYFSSGTIVDSVVLSLAYTRFYGDSMTEQTVRVYELEKDMDPDSAYYSINSIAYKETVYGEKTFIPRPGDSVLVGDDLQKPQLRIKLSDDFGTKLIEADSTVYGDNDAWLEFMKGLLITSESISMNGGMMMFDMLDSKTVLTMYYRTGTPEDTLSFEFLSNSNCARFTAYDHNDYQDASSDLKAQILNGDTTSGNELFYLQGMGGVKAQVRLPDIQKFFEDGPVAINEAKLILNVYDDGTELTPAPQLGLVGLDEEGDYVAIADAEETLSYFGGFLNEGETRYWFRISRHVQQVLNGDVPNYPLILLVQGASFRANRVILHGSDTLFNADKSMQLQVTYTKVN
jgi:hypothetical protein